MERVDRGVRGIAVVGCFVVGWAVQGHAAEWRLIKPTNSGIPGESVRFARFDPQGDLWVSARWPFFSEGGVAVRDRQTNIWETFANWDSPMPSQFVSDIEFGEGGVVWMATGGGLVKKLGDEWTIYTTLNAPLLHNAIRNIELADNGDVWVNNSTSSGGSAALFRFDGQAWEQFTVGQELPWNAPWVQLAGLEITPDGHVWVSNQVLMGVAEYDGVTWTLHGDNVNRFGKIVADLGGNVWLLPGLGGLDAFHKFDGAGFTTFTANNTPFVNTTITTAAVDADGAVYIGNWSGQVIKTADSGESWSLFTWQDQSIFTIAPSPEGDIWVTTPGAARHLSDNGVWLEAFNTYNTGLPDNFVNDILGDGQGNVWFSGGEGGFSSFGGGVWQNFGSHNPNEVWPILADGAESLFEDAAGNIWAGSNGVARWDGETLVNWDWTNSNLGVDSIVAITQTGDGTMWIGSDFSGVSWFDGQDWVHHSFGVGTASWVEDMTTDVNGDLWVATFIALHHFDGVAWESWDSSNSPLTLGGLSSVAAHPDGSIWVGTSGGLMRFDGETWTTYDQFNSPMPADEVQDVAIRSDGLVGFSTIEFGPTTPFPNGLVVFDGESWTVHTFANSPMRHYQLGAVAFDGDGDLWVSTISEGVAELDLPPATIAGDGDGDGDVDVLDFAVYLDCVTGPSGSGLPAGCDAFDFDGDQDVDFKDLGALQRAFTGSTG